MKPRITLAETVLPDGTVLSLHEHDGRHYVQSGGVQIAGPGIQGGERELARLACAPFRPVRQPKIFIVGLGLGEVVAAAAAELPQKRGRFVVAEPVADLAGWQRRFFPEGAFASDPRVEHVSDAGTAVLHGEANSLHAVLLHADTAPQVERGRFLFEDPRWLAAVHGALQAGGLLAIASSRAVPEIERKLSRSGFDVVRHQIDAAPKARRPRSHFLWLGRKGKSGERQR